MLDVTPVPKNHKHPKQLTIGEYVRLINRVNKAWKLSARKWPDSLIASKLRDLKPVLQTELLVNYPKTTYLAYDKVNSERFMVTKKGVLQPKDPLLGVKIREEKIVMDDDDLAKAIQEYREGSKDDADHLPWRIAKRVLSPIQITQFYDDEIQEFMQEYLTDVI